MILATGGAGMTGSYLLDVFPEEELFPTDLHESPGIHPLDIRNREEVMRVMARVRPRAVIHLAAETDVDRCEREPDHAYRSNLIGTLNITLACKRYGADLVYVSTAGVFDGTKPEPYTEFDEPSPINVYASSKREGEKIIQELYPQHYIVRAGWMFGGKSKDKKFVAKIASLCLDAGPTTEIRAVNDKFGSPTYAMDFLHNVKLLKETGLYGTYHVVNTGWCSRYDVAVEIARSLESDARVVPVSSDCFALPAPRPRSEAARNYKLDLLKLNAMRGWREALRDYLSSCAAQPEEMSGKSFLPAGTFPPALQLSQPEKYQEK